MGGKGARINVDLDRGDWRNRGSRSRWVGGVSDLWRREREGQRWASFLADVSRGGHQRMDIWGLIHGWFQPSNPPSPLLLLPHLSLTSGTGETWRGTVYLGHSFQDPLLSFQGWLATPGSLGYGSPGSPGEMYLGTEYTEYYSGLHSGMRQCRQRESAKHIAPGSASYASVGEHARPMVAEANSKCENPGRPTTGSAGARAEKQAPIGVRTSAAPAKPCHRLVSRLADRPAPKRIDGSHLPVAGP